MRPSDRCVLVSRVDAIGDVLLTLPLARVLKDQGLAKRVVFLVKEYTRPVVQACSYVDDILSWDEHSSLSCGESVRDLRRQGVDAVLHVRPDPRLALRCWLAGIPERIGTSHRLFHLGTCNRRVRMTRRRSPLHEAELNLLLLAPLGLGASPSLEELCRWRLLDRVGDVQQGARETRALKGLAGSRRVILHPFCRGSAPNWPMNRYLDLARLLYRDGYEVYVTGTAADRMAWAGHEILREPGVIDWVGKWTLSELIAQIASVDVLVAGSTGPLHIAAMLGRGAVGLYSDQPPVHPGRWSPLGQRVTCLAARDVGCIGVDQVRVAIARLMDC